MFIMISLITLTHEGNTLCFCMICNLLTISEKKMGENMKESLFLSYSVVSTIFVRDNNIIYFQNLPNLLLNKNLKSYLFSSLFKVIIFDLPNNIEDYIHQVGRAGRLFTQGAVMAFVNKSNKNMFVPLRELCSKSGTKLPDELINSPYMQIALDKDRKQRMEREKLSKKRKWTEDNLGEERNVTQKSLLDILRKNK